ncbi:MAG: hypothetical protein ACRDY3_13430 [Acidimicrobiales bacterium]
MQRLLEAPGAAGARADGGREDGEREGCWWGGAPAGSAGALRPAAGSRRPVDPGLAGGLRAWLEDGVAPAVAARALVSGPVLIDRWSLAAGHHERVSGAGDLTAGHLSGGNLSGGHQTVLAVRQAMVGSLFRQLVVTGTIGKPFDDAVAGLRVDDRGEQVVAFVGNLRRATRDRLRRDVEHHGRSMAARWPAMAPGWLPRTTARLSAGIAGGRVVLMATAALVLGPPAERHSSVCLVDVRAGGPMEEHASGRRYLALVETLRSGAPPCRVATYYPGTGQLVVEDPTDEALASTVVDVVDAVGRLAGGGTGGGGTGGGGRARSGHGADR